MTKGKATVKMWSSLEKSCKAFQELFRLSQKASRAAPVFREFAEVTRLGLLKTGSCEGGALPVIMSINGPHETHDYRELKPLMPGSTYCNHKPKCGLVEFAPPDPLIFLLQCPPPPPPPR